MENKNERTETKCLKIKINNSDNKNNLKEINGTCEINSLNSLLELTTNSDFEQYNKLLQCILNKSYNEAVIKTNLTEIFKILIKENKDQLFNISIEIIDHLVENEHIEKENIINLLDLLINKDTSNYAKNITENYNDLSLKVLNICFQDTDHLGISNIIDQVLNSCSETLIIKMLRLLINFVCEYGKERIEDCGFVGTIYKLYFDKRFKKIIYDLYLLLELDFPNDDEASNEYNNETDKNSLTSNFLNDYKSKNSFEDVQRQLNSINSKLNKIDRNEIIKNDYLSENLIHSFTPNYNHKTSVGIEELNQTLKSVGYESNIQNEIDFSKVEMKKKFPYSDIKNMVHIKYSFDHEDNIKKINNNIIPFQVRQEDYNTDSDKYIKILDSKSENDIKKVNIEKDENKDITKVENSHKNDIDVNVDVNNLNEKDEIKINPNNININTKIDLDDLNSFNNLNNQNVKPKPKLKERIQKQKETSNISTNSESTNNHSGFDTLDKIAKNESNNKDKTDVIKSKYLSNSEKINEVVIKEKFIKNEKIPSKNIKNEKLEENDDNNEGGKGSKDDISTKVNSIIGEENAALFNSSKWEDRKLAFYNLGLWIKDQKSIDYIVDSLISFVKLKLKNFKENNFNILKEAINVLIEILQQSKTYEKNIAKYKI